MLYKSCVTVAELLNAIKDCPPETPVTLFGAGENFPVLMIQRVTTSDGKVNEVEIGGGWISIDYEQTSLDALTLDILYSMTTALETHD